MQTSLLQNTEPDTGEFWFEMVRSWSSFRKPVGDAKRLWAVSYCDSPSVIARLFDDLQLERLELIVGNISN